MYELQKDRSQLLASAARTATTTSAQKSLIKRHTAAILYLHVTAASGTGGLKVQLRAYDTLGNAYALNGGGAGITATGSYAFVLTPSGGGTPAGDVKEIATVPVPQQFDVTVTHTDSSSYTYSLDCELIP